ncbi:hypothetical protein EC973_007926, partial [Apophysomyces ossiformis]
EAEYSAAKKRGRQLKTEETSNPNKSNKPCPSCGSIDHSKSSSKNCMKPSKTKKSVIAEKLNDNHYETFTRKLPASSVVRPEFREIFQENSVRLSAFLRELIFRAQLLVNSYIIANCERPVPSYIYTQNFWYSACQLIMGINRSQYSFNEASKTFNEMLVNVDLMSERAFAE